MAFLSDMKTKNTKKVKVVDVIEPKMAENVEITLEIPKEAVKLTPTSVNLGREDLNQLVNKINEIIDFLNK